MKPLKFISVIAACSLLCFSIVAEVISFGWTDPNPVGAATGYNLYQATNSSGPFVLVSTITTTNAFVTNAPQTSLWYYVTCFNDRGETVPSNIVNVKAPLLGVINLTITVKK